MTLGERELARGRLLVLDAYLAAAARRSDVLEATALAGNPEEAVHAVAELLGIGRREARAVVELRLLRFTRTEMEGIRVERDSLRDRIERRP